ncbi:hypothetical protein PoMZ_13534 [Pyricularia oryzae]|uniref:Uncharacterized protein n=1 Tax=Pyricularia oryzae TaxID=318829 RepID=A0A4P7NVQ5_PYROR|nr:hypothetical protein PoMZ_13534 [Pyricularia oryzae]
MRSAIIFLSVFATGALALPANLCAGPGDTTVLCTREDSTSTDRTLERREPIREKSRFRLSETLLEVPRSSQPGTQRKDMEA